MTDDRNTPELPTLARYLDSYRDIVVWKLDGLERDQAVRSLVPSRTTLLGLVKHLARVERYWFQHVLAGDATAFPHGVPDPDAEWRIEPGETIADVVAAYRQAVDESRAVLDAFSDGGQLVPHEDGEVSVRRVLIHMIEETARHAGHADILREQIDGTTGFSPG